MPYNSRHRPPTPGQRKLADRLRIRLKRSDTIGVVAARLMDAVIDEVRPANGWSRPSPHDEPSDEQRDLAQRLHLPLNKESKRVAAALIADRIEERRLAYIHKLKLSPGAIFCTERYGGHRLVTIQSIGPDGLVRLAGERGWPRWPEDLHAKH
jgi:hypothetical protein